MKQGDNITVAGIIERIPNPNRKWCQIWKPRLINGPLKVFTIVNRT